MKSIFYQSVLWHPGCFFILNKTFQNSSVFDQGIIDIPDNVHCLAFQLIVIIIAAIVITEFFIGSALHRIAAIKTFCI